MNSFFSKNRWILIVVASGAALALALAIYARPKPEPVVAIFDKSVGQVSAVDEPVVEDEVIDVDETVALDTAAEESATPTQSNAAPEADKALASDRLAEETTETETETNVTASEVSESAPLPVEEATEDPALVIEADGSGDETESVSEDSTETEAADENVAAPDTAATSVETAATDDEVAAEEEGGIVEEAAAALSSTTAEASSDGVKPSFDIVRVDSSGSAVVAGSAEPSSKVVILSNGEQIGEATADNSGEFVAIIQVPNSQQGQTLELESEVGGQLLFSDETILILPTFNSAAADAVTDETPPAIIRATEDEVVIVQGATQLALGQVSLDSISYDADEEVVLAGRGNPGRRVIIYVDDKPLMDTLVSESGSWKQALHGLDAGRYVLRVDEIDDAGTVTSRVESPFQREYPEDVREAKSNTSPTYTVQPGNSLWVIATGRYGDGLKYHQIFTANQDQIRDPDLIYPGQVFALPNPEE